MSSPVRRYRVSFLIFFDRKPVSSCMAGDAEDALAFARQWVDDRDYSSLSVRAEADCTADDLEALHASESARCDAWTTARASGVDGSLSIA